MAARWPSTTPSPRAKVAFEEVAAAVDLVDSVAADLVAVEVAGEDAVALVVGVAEEEEALEEVDVDGVALEVQKTILFIAIANVSSELSNLTFWKNS